MCKSGESGIKFAMAFVRFNLAGESGASLDGEAGFARDVVTGTIADTSPGCVATVSPQPNILQDNRAGQRKEKLAHGT